MLFRQKILKEAKPSKDEITSRVNCTVDAVISSSSQNDHALQALYSLKNAKLYYINESVKNSLNIKAKHRVFSTLSIIENKENSCVIKYSGKS